MQRINNRSEAYPHATAICKWARNGIATYQLEYNVPDEAYKSGLSVLAAILVPYFTQAIKNEAEFLARITNVYLTSRTEDEIAQIKKGIQSYVDTGFLSPELITLLIQNEKLPFPPEKTPENKLPIRVRILDYIHTEQQQNSSKFNWQREGSLRKTLTSLAHVNLHENAWQGESVIQALSYMLEQPIEVEYPANMENQILHHTERYNISNIQRQETTEFKPANSSFVLEYGDRSIGNTKTPICLRYITERHYHFYIGIEHIAQSRPAAAPLTSAYIWQELTAARSTSQEEIATTTTALDYNEEQQELNRAIELSIQLMQPALPDNDEAGPLPKVCTGKETP